MEEPPPPPDVSPALLALLARPHTTLLAEAAHGFASEYIAEPLQPIPERRFDVLLSLMRDAPESERADAIAVLRELRHWHGPIAWRIWDRSIWPTLEPGDDAPLVAALTSGSRAQVTEVYGRVTAYLRPQNPESRRLWAQRLEALARAGRCPVLSLAKWDAFAGKGDDPPRPPSSKLACAPSDEAEERIDSWHYRGPEVLLSDLDAGRVALEDAMPHVLNTHGAQGAARWPTDAIVVLARRIRTLPNARREVALLFLAQVVARVEPNAALGDALVELLRDVPVGSKSWVMQALAEHPALWRGAWKAAIRLAARQDVLPRARGMALHPGLTPDDALLLFARSKREDAGLPESAYAFRRETESAYNPLWSDEEHLFAPLLQTCTERSRAHPLGMLDPRIQGACSSILEKAPEAARDLEGLLPRARGMFLLRVAGTALLAGKPLSIEVRTALAKNPLTRAPFFDFLKTQHVSAALFPAPFATEKAMLESIVAREVALALGGPPDDIEAMQESRDKTGDGRLVVRFRVHAPRLGAERGWMRGVVTFNNRDLRASTSTAFFTRYSEVLPTHVPPWSSD